jgi:hypothetical protein
MSKQSSGQAAKCDGVYNCPAVHNLGGGAQADLQGHAGDSLLITSTDFGSESNRNNVVNVVAGT